MCQCHCTGTAPDGSGLGGGTLSSMCLFGISSNDCAAVSFTACIIAKTASDTFKHKAWLGSEDVPCFVPSVSGACSPHPNHPLAMRCLQGWVFPEILNCFSSPSPDKNIHSAVYEISNTPAADRLGITNPRSIPRNSAGQRCGDAITVLEMQ